VSKPLSLVFPVAVLAFAGGLILDLGAARTPQTPAPSGPAIDAAVLKAYQWRSIGPLRGGRSIAVTGVKGRPKERSSGHRRRPLEDHRRRRELDAGDGRPDRSSSVGAVAVSESNPDVVYIGMGNRASAATSCRATGCTSRRTRARPGRTSASATAASTRSRRFASTGESRRRVRRGIRQMRYQQRRARRLQDDRRRQVMEESAVP
jgi:hypothetical protein